MISHRLLTHEKILDLLPSLNVDENLLLYSYLTQRKEKALFFCQFVKGNLTAILAYFRELSFPAFSFFPVNNNDLYLPQLITFTRETLKLDENVIGGTILNMQELELFKFYGLITGAPEPFFTMKQQDESKLLESQLTERIIENEFSKAIGFLQNGGMRFFTKSELENYPFLGIKEGPDFVAVGGYHFYDTNLVEIGNIVTRVDCRGKGLAKHLTSELTFLGKQISSDIYLGVLADNLPAVRLYEGLGFGVTADFFIVNFTLSSTLSCFKAYC